MEKLKQQLAEIKQELKKSPRNPGLLNELGVSYHMTGEYEQAVTAYQQSLKHKSDDYRVHFNLGNTFFEQQQISKAISYYLNALDIKTDYVPALNNLADAYDFIDERKKARELFTYITQIEPDDPLGYFNLGNHYLKSNHTVEAGRCYKKVIALDSEFYEAYNNIGFILKEIGQFEEAIPYFEQCLEIAPDYKPARTDLRACCKALEGS